MFEQGLHTLISPPIWNCHICQHRRGTDTHTRRENTVWTVSQHCVCVLTIDIGRVGHWRGAELRPQPPQIDCQAKIEGAAKEKWLHLSFYFPHLGRPLDRTLTRCGWQWREGKSELEGQRGFKLATKIAASCLSLPPGQCAPFSLSMVVCRNLLSTFNIYFYSNGAQRGAMIMIWSGEKKGGWNSWGKVECMTMCLLSTEPAGHGNLYPVSTWSNRAREAWAGHRSWCQVSQRVLAESAVWKQTSLPVQLDTEPTYRMKCVHSIKWTQNQAPHWKLSLIFLSCLLHIFFDYRFPDLSLNLDSLTLF